MKLETISPQESVSCFAVMSEPCDQCLMSPGKIVSDERRKELLQQCAKNDDHFICHKATIAGYRIGCRAHFDATGGGQMGRIAGRLGLLRQVELSSLEKEDNGPCNQIHPSRGNHERI